LFKELKAYFSVENMKNWLKVVIKLHIGDINR